MIGYIACNYCQAGRQQIRHARIQCLKARKEVRMDSKSKKSMKLGRL